MIVSNLVQVGATTEEIAKRLAVSADVVKTYVAKAHRSASQSLAGMIVTNLLPTGASDKEIADVLAVSEDKVEGIIANLPVRVTGEEIGSSEGSSSVIPSSPSETPVPAAPTPVPEVTAVPVPAPTAVPEVTAAPAPTPTAVPTPTAIRVAKVLPGSDDEDKGETARPAPGTASYSSDARGRRMIGIIGIILSPLLLIAHAHAVRRRKLQA